MAMKRIIFTVLFTLFMGAIVAPNSAMNIDVTAVTAIGGDCVNAFYFFATITLTATTDDGGYDIAALVFYDGYGNAFSSYNQPYGLGFNNTTFPNFTIPTAAIPTSR